MNIDGKVNVKERIKIFESDDFTTYLYKFENGNKYTDTISKWKQKDFKYNVYKTPEERLENRLDTLILKRC
jgi:hypothetical protein